MCPRAGALFHDSGEQQRRRFLVGSDLHAGPVVEQCRPSSGWVADLSIGFTDYLKHPMLSAGEPILEGLADNGLTIMFTANGDMTRDVFSAVRPHPRERFGARRADFSLSDVGLDERSFTMPSLRYLRDHGCAAAGYPSRADSVVSSTNHWFRFRVCLERCPPSFSPRGRTS